MNDKGWGKHLRIWEKNILGHENSRSGRDKYMVVWGQKDVRESGACRGGDELRVQGRITRGTWVMVTIDGKSLEGLKRQTTSELFLKVSFWQLCREWTVGHGAEAEDLLECGDSRGESCGSD